MKEEMEKQLIMLKIALGCKEPTEYSEKNYYNLDNKDKEILKMFESIIAYIERIEHKLDNKKDNDTLLY